MTRCPHCGNTAAETIETNGALGQELVRLCTKPCEPEDSTFDDAHDDEDRRMCGMMWGPGL